MSVANMPQSAYSMTQYQLEKISALLNLSRTTTQLLSRSTREYVVTIPVTMDDGQIELFQGYRVHHNDARGPCAGGFRLHPQASIDTVRALAMWMTWKCAAVNIPLGGAGGSVVCDLHGLSRREQEQICRGWVRQMFRNIGPLIDTPAPDLMTTSQHLLWMLDEYETINGARCAGAVSGKPVSMGGSPGRQEAPGYGVVITMREALKLLGVEPGTTSASIQGFGAVGQSAALLYHQMGGTVVSVACWNQYDQIAYTFRKKDGIEPEKLVEITNLFGEIDKSKALDLGYEVLSADAWLEQDVDILIPAAFENMITAQNVHKISPQVILIAEGANAPTTPEADSVIEKRGILMIPDCVANAGGMMCSYFEQIQSNANDYWQKDEVFAKLDAKLTDAFVTIMDLAEKQRLYPRDAAHMIAVDRVVESCRARGWI